MALHRIRRWAIFYCLCGAALLTGCNNQKIEGQTKAVPVVEVSADTKAIADVDKRATLALKQSLLNSFPQNTASRLVEEGLAKDGFDCTPNPSAPNERACLMVAKEGRCEINTIVRTAPYAPEKAQVIKICEVGPQVSPP